MAEEIKKIPLTSMDLKEHQLLKLKDLFPEVFTEGQKIDWEKLKLTLGEDIDTGKERFGMNWAGKADCYKTIQQPSIATLIPAREESIDFDTTQNLFIEGDNLEVLKLLQKSYLGKVKMIYIDPPYNTGGDFIYPDNYSENLDTYLQYTGQVDGEGKKFATNTETDGRFHSKWMNMMYPRLFLAKNLLKEDGVIFVSIDDNEVHNLRALCNEIFGEENFLGETIWQHSIQPKGYTGKFSVHHNYNLVYQKSQDFELKSLERTDEHNKSYSNPDNDPKGQWRTGDVRNALYRPNLIYELKTPSGKTIQPPKNGWRWSKQTMAEKIKTGEIVFSQDETRIIRKIYLNSVDGRTPETIWFGKEVGTTRDASEEIKELFDGVSYFDTPKPTKLIQRMAELSVDKSDIILDFFAGSCTTAHAVLELNKEDGGNRKFICVQLPQPVEETSEASKVGYKSIADISKERIRKVINKLKNESSDIFTGDTSNLDLGFKVFKLAKSNFNVWDSSMEKQPEVIQGKLELHTEHISPEATQESILFELLLKSGFPLTTPIEHLTIEGKKVFSIAEGELLICLEEELTHELLKAIAEKQPSRVICLDKAFKGDNADALKTNAVQIMKSKGVINFRTV